MSQEGIGLDLCDMIDGPIPVAWVIESFAIPALVAVLGGALRVSRFPSLRFLGVTLLALTGLVCVWLTMTIHSWGIVGDLTRCEDLSETATLAILFSLNLCVVLAARVPRFLFSRRKERHRRTPAT
jgi:hypothetical protein